MARWMVKGLAVAAPIVVSCLLDLIVVVLLPSPYGAWVFYGGAGMVVLLWWRGDRFALNVLTSRALRDGEVAILAPALTMVCRAGLGPPVVEVRVQSWIRQVGITVTGRRSVIITAGFLDGVFDGVITQDVAAVGIARAASLARDGWTRHDPVLTFVMFPWLLLAGIVEVVAHVGQAFPLTTLAWQMRFVTIATAVVLSYREGQWALSVGLVGLGTLSYLIPIWRRAWEAAVLYAGDRALVEAGLGAPTLALLTRAPRTRLTRARIQRLTTPPAAPTPGPRLIT